MINLGRLQMESKGPAMNNRKLAALAKLDAEYGGETPSRWQMDGSQAVDAFSVLANQNVQPPIFNPTRSTLLTLACQKLCTPKSLAAGDYNWLIILNA